MLVRHIPTIYEGDKVRGCDHYAWTYCKGWDTTHNEKCKGSNRHDPCPKYLANCTLWKHKLPPKVSTKGHIVPVAVTLSSNHLSAPVKRDNYFGGDMLLSGMSSGVQSSMNSMSSSPSYMH